MKALDEFGLTPVERRYQQALDRMTGMEKMRRTAISERELRFRVAERLSMGDPAFLALLRRAYERG